MRIAPEEDNAHGDIPTDSKTNAIQIVSQPQLLDIRNLPVHQMIFNNEKISTKFFNSSAPNFSLFHSNILYLCFFVGTFFCLAADSLLQLEKNHFINDITKLFLALFLINILLWIDFNINFSKSTRSSIRKYKLCEDICQDTTHLLFCLVIAPFLWIAKLIRFEYSMFY